jgi:hypothetical protein
MTVVFSRRIAFSTILFVWSSMAWAGPKGTVVVRPVADGAITIDGDVSDWSLTSFVQPSQQPPFPDARDADATDARGDHIVFVLDRVGLFNGTPDCSIGPCGFTNQGPIDFGSSIYFARDSKALYMLGVFIDETLRGDRDTTEFGSSNYLNDGLEIFIDALGDSTDIADELNNPPNTNFDDDQAGVTPNLDDFQITFGLNDNFPSPAGPGSVGARQHMERAGQPGLLGGFGQGQPWEIFPDVIADERNGPGGVYRDALGALGTPDIAARSVADLRAAGAQNPEIAANPNVIFPGYVMEAAIPFMFIPEFTPNHDMGFALFWRDTDEDGEPDAGGGNISWADWTQNTEVRGAEGPGGQAIGLFHTGNWGKLEFEGRFNVVRLLAGDADQDLDFDQLDLVKVQIAGKYLTGQSATWGEGDWNGAPGGRPGDPPLGDRLFNQLDIIAALAAGTYLTGPYAAIAKGGQRGDLQTSIVYDAGTGEVAVDAPAGQELTSINIDSAAGIFTGDAAANLGGSFDNDANTNIFKATFGSSFGSLSFGRVAQPGLSEQFVLADLAVVGSLAGGGDLGNVDLIYIPEPASAALLAVGVVALALATRGRRG